MTVGAIASVATAVVQAFLRHSNPAFTLGVYVHHLEGDLPGPDFCDVQHSIRAASGPAMEESSSGARGAACGHG